MKRTLQPGVGAEEPPAESTDLLRRRPPKETLDWVAGSVGPGGKIVSVERLTDGHWHANHAVTVEQDGETQDLVLRRWARPEWKSEDPDFTADREATALALLEAADVPTPRVIGVDSDGVACDVPAILTDRLPGRPPEHEPAHRESFLNQLAGVLAPIHAVGGSKPQQIPAYRRYFERLDLHAPPAWSQKPELWERAAEIVVGDPPGGRTCFIHRDYHPGNTLWEAGRLTGVVDWTQASWGSPAVDTAHMRWNLTVAYGLDPAERFLELYESLSSKPERDQHYWDLVTVLDVLPDLNPDDLPPNWKLERLDQYVEKVLRRIG